MLKNEILSLVQTYGKELTAPPPFIPGKSYIPIASQVMDHTDLTGLVEACLDLRFAGGPRTKDFEQKLSPWFGRSQRAVLVNSGSSANLLAVSALGLKPGDEVITAAAGFPTTVNPIVQNGAVPVFIDVERENLNATVGAVLCAMTKKTKAVIFAHTLGNPFRADTLAEELSPFGIPLIEDCCDAIGSLIGDKRAGSFGEIATTSFYPAHHITMGEGGAVICKNMKTRLVVESLRDWGRDCWCEPGKDNTCRKRFDQKMGDLPCGYDHKYTYSRIGYNLKATELQASLGITQLEHLESFIAKRRENWAALNDGFRNSPILQKYFKPVSATVGTSPSWFGFPVHCQNGLDRRKVTRYLEERRIGSRMVFAGNLTAQPAYQNIPFRIHGSLSNTDFIMNSTFWIGCHPAMGKPQIDYVLETMESIPSLDS